MKSESQFKPAWWLPNPHLQTLWPIFFRKEIKNLSLERERLELPDGDFIDLDWIDKRKQGPTVLILHGFEGSIHSHYAKGMLRAIKKIGWRGVFMHFRGCSGEPNRLATSYHSGETNDVQYVAKILREREPNMFLAAIGFSLGGNILLKWLGETGEDNPIKAAIAISVPFELSKAAERVQVGFSKLYQWYLIKCVCKNLSKKFENITAPIDTSVLTQVSTIYEFDDLVTAPLHGFNSVDEYYSLTSSRQFLSTIQVPTLILHSKDDPFISASGIPHSQEVSSTVKLEITEAGGHVGFVSGKYPWNPEYWLEERVSRFLQEFTMRSC